jgi:anti-sigma factor RsiW
MARCKTVQENLTAWIDRALPHRWDDRIRRHVAACARCAAEAESLRSAIESQRHALSALLASPDFDTRRSQVRLAQALATERAAHSWTWHSPEWIEPTWQRLMRPLAVAGATLAVAGVLLAVAGGPAAVLIPLGVESPPPAVAREPDLYKDYPLIQHLDALEHFDTVESTPLDDDQGTQNG